LRDKGYRGDTDTAASIQAFVGHYYPINQKCESVSSHTQEVGRSTIAGTDVDDVDCVARVGGSATRCRHRERVTAAGVRHNIRVKKGIGQKTALIVGRKIEKAGVRINALDDH
jgi:hypothetical protein